MFENLTDKLERSFKLIKGEGRITEINVAETLKDVRRALLDADVNYNVARDFTDQVKEKARDSVLQLLNRLQAEQTQRKPGEPHLAENSKSRFQ